MMKNIKECKTKALFEICKCDPVTWSYWNGLMTSHWSYTRILGCPRGLPRLACVHLASLTHPTLLLILCRPAPLAFYQDFEGILFFLPLGLCTCCPTFYLLIHSLAVYSNLTLWKKLSLIFQAIWFALYFALTKSHFFFRSAYFRT